MTKLIRIQEYQGPVEKTGQLSWALDLSLLSAAAVCVVITTVAGGLWVNRSREAPAIVLKVAPGADRDLAEAQAGPMGAPLLWVAKKGDATVYLFGSVHLLPPGTTWMDQRLFVAFDSADQAWFESRNLDRLPPVTDSQVTVGADVALFRRAKMLDKSVGGFEADRSPRGKAGTGFSDDGVNVTVAAWQRGDQKAMTTHVKALAKSDPEIYRWLLSDRHKAWLPRIEGMMNTPGTAFVTLGAAHMVGPDGIVAELRRRGYDVARMDVR
ncbi:TraB/GumN family protein [Asticcacaulis biprosthecium]|uniref:TraB/GumN family protein n=1 Tax=Asticcacaulis biprosthecium TaxID=76891 RepID=UPI000303DB51|nr:TraB/GumN family protein [Asticcacaulis biprosthecium]